MQNLIMFKKWFNRSKSEAQCAMQSVGLRALNGKHVATGKELIFISRIERDGSGVIDVSEMNMSAMDNTIFVLNCLSVSNKTYVASEFNIYVVRLRQKA